ncbi:MAG: hypothetical protein DWQ17_03645, partial [Crenarchaeota archaeon]
MAKWADFLISEASYDSDHRITYVRRHKDNGVSIDPIGEIISRADLTHDLQNRISYSTVFSSLNTWKVGQKIRGFRVDNSNAIRIDNNKVQFDNLGSIPEIRKDSEIPAPEPKPAPAPEPKPAPAPEPKPAPAPEPKPAPAPEP